MSQKKLSLYGLLIYLEKLSSLSLWILATALLIFLGLVDYWTGFELAFSYFYVIPVMIATWGIGKKTGLFFAFASSIFWLIANWAAGEVFSSELIAFWNAGIRFSFFITISGLLSGLKEALNTERDLARTDPLTGVLNRRAFYDLANRKIVFKPRVRRPFSVIYLDLDNFKQVNDQLGHAKGDEVLKIVASALHRQIRADDMIARLGGDEFVIWLSDAEPEAAKGITARLQNVLQAEMSMLDLDVTFSMGVMTFLQSPESIDKIIGLTDELMYNIKGTGKNAAVYAVYEG